MKPFRLRIVGDLHSGDRLGLWPPGFTYQGQPFSQNDAQAYLWQCWMHMAKSHPVPDAIVFNGDSVGGPNYKEGGAGTVAPELDIQQEGLLTVMAPAVEGVKRRYLIEGTGYHERSFAAIARAIGATKWEDGGRYGQVLDLAVRGHVLNIAHHPEGGSTLYKGTTLDKETLWAVIAAGVGKIPLATVIVRSHWHFYASYQGNGRTSVHVPAWQLQTPRMKKQSYFRFQPDIGFVDLVIEKDEPYPHVQPVIYPLPVKRVTRVA